jgi:hypothetical protein
MEKANENIGGSRNDRAANVARLLQGMSGKKHRGEQKTEQKSKVDEKGYNSALRRMPDQKYDPWQTLRGSEPATNGKKLN